MITVTWSIIEPASGDKLDTDGTTPYSKTKEVSDAQAAIPFTTTDTLTVPAACATDLHMISDSDTYRAALSLSPNRQ